MPLAVSPTPTRSARSPRATPSSTPRALQELSESAGVPRAFVDALRAARGDDPPRHGLSSTMLAAAAAVYSSPFCEQPLPSVLSPAVHARHARTMLSSGVRASSSLHSTPNPWGNAKNIPRDIFHEPIFPPPAPPDIEDYHDGEDDDVDNGNRNGYRPNHDKLSVESAPHDTKAAVESLLARISKPIKAPSPLPLRIPNSCQPATVDYDEEDNESHEEPSRNKRNRGSTNDEDIDHDDGSDDAGNKDCMDPDVNEDNMTAEDPVLDDNDVPDDNPQPEHHRDSILQSLTNVIARAAAVSKSKRNIPVSSADVDALEADVAPGEPEEPTADLNPKIDYVEHEEDKITEDIELTNEATRAASKNESKEKSVKKRTRPVTAVTKVSKDSNNANMAKKPPSGKAQRKGKKTQSKKQSVRSAQPVNASGTDGSPVTRSMLRSRVGDITPKRLVFSESVTNGPSCASSRDAVATRKPVTSASVPMKNLKDAAEITTRASRARGIKRGRVDDDMQATTSVSYEAVEADNDGNGDSHEITRRSSRKPTHTTKRMPPASTSKAEASSHSKEKRDIDTPAHSTPSAATVEDGSIPTNAGRDVNESTISEVGPRRSPRGGAPQVKKPRVSASRRDRTSTATRKASASRRGKSARDEVRHPPRAMPPVRRKRMSSEVLMLQKALASASWTDSVAVENQTEVIPIDDMDSHRSTPIVASVQRLASSAKGRKGKLR